MAAPLMKAKLGTPSVASLPNTRWPRRPISSTCSCDGQLPEDAEVGADAEDERLAGEADGHEVVASSDLVECGLQ